MTYARAPHAFDRQFVRERNQSEEKIISRSVIFWEKFSSNDVSESFRFTARNLSEDKVWEEGNCASDEAREFD